MPAVNFYTDQSLSLEQKRRFAKVLTETAEQTYETWGESKKGLFICQFHFIHPENIAFNGQLVADGAVFSHRLEYTSMDLKNDQKPVLAQAFVKSLLQLLNLPNNQDGLSRIRILFNAINREDFMFGTKFAQSLNT